MFRSKGKSGFTLIEVMVVVMVIAIILAISVPAYLSMKNKSQMYACIGNLRQIDTAKARWSAYNGDNGGAPLAIADIVPEYLKKMPSCPAGGTYVIGNIASSPACSVSRHVLPENGG